MYHHTQFGTLVVWAVGAVLFLILVIAIATGWNPWVFLGATLMALLLFLFHSLTVEVNDKLVVVRFGPGIIRRSFAVESIRESKTVRNRWYYGWGIRWTPHGWLFNISGLDAVQIKLESGKQYRIGTDQPGELLAAIRNVCRPG